MNVFVVERNTDYEGSIILGIFSAYEKATAFMDKNTHLEGPFEWMSLQEYEVDNEE